VPLLFVDLDCEDEGRPRIDVRQERYAPLGSSIDPHAGAWQVPMCVAYIADGEAKSRCTLLNQREQSVSLDAESCPTHIHPNADGAGYYRFSLDDDAWAGLIAGAQELPASEALVLTDSLHAGFRAGQVSAETYASGMAALVNHSAWDVADLVTKYLEEIADVVADDQLDSLLRAYRNIVRPRYSKLGEGSDAGTSLLRRRMQRFLVVIARDPSMREALAKSAAAVVGLNGDADPSAAPLSQLETILTVGVQDLGEPFFDRLMEQAQASEEPAFRRAATGALARAEDPALVANLQASMLAGEFRNSETSRMLFRQMVRRRTTDLTFDWLKDNTEAIVERLPAALTGSILPSLGSAFCSVDRADEWQTFIEAHAELLPGYQRDLAQATESIRLCAALRNARAAALVTAFARTG
jgi:aminopeptidase N